MRFVSTALIATLTLAATVVLAADAVEPAAKARQELMDTIALNTKVLGEMAGGKVSFDAASAVAARDALIAAAEQIPAKYEAQTTDPASKVKPEIWTNFASFTAKGEALTAAAKAIDPASAETLQAGMGAIGGTCKDCHTTFRN